MSDQNQGGMRNFEEDAQPNPFQMQDSSDDLMPYEGFLNHDYEASSAEDLHDDVEEPAPGGINYDEDDNEGEDDSEKKIIENQNQEESGLDYEDDDAPKETEEFKAEEALAKLEALGYKIEKDNASDPMKLKENQIQELDRVNSDLRNYAKADDLTLCREHVIDDIIKTWQKDGRTADINSEEFKLEVEYEMEQFMDNPRLAKLQANDVRQILNNAIEKNESSKKVISDEVKQTRDKELQQNRKTLQTTFDQYNGKVLFGQKVTPRELKSAYKSITNGDFTKQVESDTALQVEFSLFLGMRDKISKSGGGTYNEGIRDAIAEIEGTGPKVESSLAKTVSRNGSGSVIDRASAWRAITEVKKPK